MKRILLYLLMLIVCLPTLSGELPIAVQDKSNEAQMIQVANQQNVEQHTRMDADNSTKQSEMDSMTHDCCDDNKTTETNQCCDASCGHCEDNCGGSSPALLAHNSLLAAVSALVAVPHSIQLPQSPHSTSLIPPIA